MFYRIRSNLKWKLILIFTLIMLSVILSISILNYRESSKTIRTETERFSSQLLKQTNLNLNRYYRDYEDLIYLIGGTSDFMSWVKTPPANDYLLFKTYQSIENYYVEPFFRLHSEILSLTMYNENGNQMIFPGRNAGVVKYMEYKLTDEYELSQIPLTNFIERRVWESHTYLELGPNYAPVMVISFLKKYQYHGASAYIVLDVALTPTLAILEQIDLGSKGKGMLIDRDGTIIVHPEPGKQFQPLDSHIFEQIRHMSSGALFFRNANQAVFVNELEKSNEWKTVITIPYDQLMASSKRVRQMTVTITLAGIVIAVLLISFVCSTITSRILELRRGMKRTAINQFEHKVAVHGQDEITDLALVYNELLERLQISVQDLTESRLLQQEAILSALQAQINSHFLYNALESINSMSNLRDQPEIGTIAIYLSKMLRYTSNYTKTVVTLEDELEHLNHYLYIIGILYGESVQYEIEVDPEVMSAPCLKAICQPIVENSIKHGLENDTDMLLIQIKAEQHAGDAAKITFSDNGPGFSSAKLAELQAAMTQLDSGQKLQRTNRIGLLNVHYRLSYFNRHRLSQMHIGNLPEGGAQVSILLSLKSEIIPAAGPF
jgi:two-component system sensor histidine kinase YesM